ncbi:MAG TPA: hypothetical protein VI685_08975 [Candidatus Angelobacter sp.]
MKRRELLRGLFALSAAGILNGCRDGEKGDHDHEPKNPATLKVVLQGPFAVVLKKKDKTYSVSAFIPPDPKHQFRFQLPSKEGIQTSAPKYQFTLGPEGLDINERRRPYMDHGLDDMNFDLGEYPAPDFFVAVDLPVPDLITFIPPSEPVVFVDGRIAFAALNHILEYKIADEKKVLLHSKELGDQHPLPFSEMFKHHQEHTHSEQEYSDKKGHGPQNPHTQSELGRPSESEVFTYFLGVGVPPGAMSDPEAVQHGLDFFNKKLVPLFPNSRNLKELSEIRNYGDPCTMGKTAPSRMKPTVLRQSEPKPRLLLVTGVEDCRSPGLTGHP